MKLRSIHLGSVCLMLLLFRAPASVLYVDLNCTNSISPYIDWSTAATNIQNAVDAATVGDQILVTNGIYEAGASSNLGSNRVNITKAVILKSVNGPNTTIIKGYQVPGTTNGAGAVRCVNLASGATLSGFTLTNGATQTIANTDGGGVYCQSSNAIVTNCIVIGNSAFDKGAGAYRGTIITSKIVSNLAGVSGSGAIGAILYNCLVLKNYGLDALQNATAFNCTIVSNTVGDVCKRGCF